MHLGSSNVCVTGLSKKLRMEYAPPPPEVSKYSGKALKRKKMQGNYIQYEKKNLRAKLYFFQGPDLGPPPTAFQC